MIKVDKSRKQSELLQIRISKEQKAKLVELAISKDISMSSMVKYIVSEYIEANVPMDQLSRNTGKQALVNSVSANLNLKAPKFIVSFEDAIRLINSEMEKVR